MPSSPGERPLSELHFLQLCDRLDHLEGLILAQKPVFQDVQQTQLEGGVSAPAPKPQLQSPSEVLLESAPEVSAPGSGASTQSAGKGECAEVNVHRNEERKSTKKSESGIGKLKTSGQPDGHHRRHNHLVDHIVSDTHDPTSSASGTQSSWFRRAFWQSKARHVLHFRARSFDLAVGFVILVNAVCIGLEIQFSLEGKTVAELNYLEHVFLCIFLVDLILRVLANEKGYLWSGWFFLESALVVIGILSEWILRPLLEVTSSHGALEAFRQILILRILRLLRLVRALRLLEMFEQLWKLANGLVHSAKTVIYALILVLLTTYIFACFAVEAITQSESLRENPATREIVEDRFYSLFRASLTLLAFTNADSVASVYEPLIEQNPLLAPFFAVVWLCITVSLMNLVTAVIVDNAITQSREDKETKQQETRKRVKVLLPEIQRLFDSLDQSKDGSLEIEELDLGNVSMPDELRAIVDEDRLKDLFQYLDEDGSGSVDKDEFTDGVMNLALQNVPIETTQTLQLLRSQQVAVTRIQRMLEELTEEDELSQPEPMV